MKKWNDRELNAVQWALSYLPLTSLDQRHREGILSLRERPGVQHMDYSDAERDALKSAIEYFEELYGRLLKGLPKGNRTVSESYARIKALKDAKEKLCKAELALAE